MVETSLMGFVCMIMTPLCCVITLLLLLPFSSAATGVFVPRDDILLNCGPRGQSNDTDGRTWSGNVGSKFNPSLTSPVPSRPPRTPPSPRSRTSPM